MERKPRKKNKRYTLMVVPHSNGAIKSLPIPLWIINSFAVFGFICLLVVSYLGISYFSLQITLDENSKLKNTNNFQAQEIKELQNSTQDALEKLADIIAADSKIRELVGLKEIAQNDVLSSRSQGLSLANGRSVQAMAVKDSDVLENMSIETEPFLNTTSRIKFDLEKINNIISDREQILEELELDVKNRLDYLAAIPSGWPVKGRITSSYGWRKNPFNKKSRDFHDGIDIATTYGTPVKAAGAGKVAFVGWKPVFGNTVVINHGYGYVSHYAHNSSTNVKAGQKVERGDIIARLGSTGRSTGPHVHFGVSLNGSWIDPLKVLGK